LGRFLFSFIPLEHEQNAGVGEFVRSPKVIK